MFPSLHGSCHEISSCNLKLKYLDGYFKKYHYNSLLYFNLFFCFNVRIRFLLKAKSVSLIAKNLLNVINPISAGLLENQNPMFEVQI